MKSKESFLERFRQNNNLPIRVVSPGFGHLSSEYVTQYVHTRQTSHYFFLFMIDGSSRHKINLQPYEVNNNELLFILPNQLHELPAEKNAADYFKIGFDESCLSRLPKQYPFLINALNNQKILIAPAAAARLKSIFEILLELLSVIDTDPDLILAYLNSLLTEINSSYFSAGKSPADDNLSKFIDFKVFVENNLTDHPTIQAIAQELTLNTHSLYHIVKQYSGQSPKAFITNRLILEARRRLSYHKSTSIKELAFELGFNDPDYFSRLFKKVTGKTITSFFQDLSGK